MMENCFPFRDDEQLTVEPVNLNVARAIILHAASEEVEPHGYRIERDGRVIMSLELGMATLCRMIDCEDVLEDFLDPNAT